MGRSWAEIITIGGDQMLAQTLRVIQGQVRDPKAWMKFLTGVDQGADSLTQQTTQIQRYLKMVAWVLIVSVLYTMMQEHVKTSWKKLNSSHRKNKKKCQNSNQIKSLMNT
jgi:hypothetical protein